MSETGSTLKTKPHWSFWLIVSFALIWNLMGSVNFLMQLNPEFVASLPESHKPLVEGRPFWASAAFALTVFGGALGCLMLLLKKPLARTLLAVSLAAVIFQLFHTLPLVMSMNLSTGEFIMMVAMVPVMATFLVWYAARAKNKGWL